MAINSDCSGNFCKRPYCSAVGRANHVFSVHGVRRRLPRVPESLCPQGGRTGPLSASEPETDSHSVRATFLPRVLPHDPRTATDFNRDHHGDHRVSRSHSDDAATVAGNNRFRSRSRSGLGPDGSFHFRVSGACQDGFFISSRGPQPTGWLMLAAEIEQCNLWQDKTNAY